ncbi:hypothetical protein PG984_000094 [Apiospora sp. TS-2023a]
MSTIEADTKDQYDTFQGRGTVKDEKTDTVAEPPPIMLTETEPPELVRELPLAMTLGPVTCTIQLLFMTTLVVPVIPNIIDDVTTAWDRNIVGVPNYTNIGI